MPPLTTMPLSLEPNVRGKRRAEVRNAGCHMLLCLSFSHPAIAWASRRSLSVLCLCLEPEPELFCYLVETQ